MQAPSPSPNRKAWQVPCPSLASPKGQGIPNGTGPSPAPTLPQAPNRATAYPAHKPALCRNVQSPCAITQKVQNVLPRNPTAQTRNASQSNRATCKLERAKERASQAPPPCGIYGRPPPEEERGDLLTEFLLFNKSPSFCIVVRFCEQGHP